MSEPADKTATNTAQSGGPLQLLRRLVVLQPGEGPVLLAAFAMLFFVFTSYSVLRPVRDTMGSRDVENLPMVFWGTFVIMLIIQPIYGWLTSRFQRKVFLPWVYSFFVLNLLAFYLWFNLQQDHTWIGRTYFIWVSVFNLFVIAAFWSLMSDVLTREQAGRMFGFIAAGMSVGGLVGPILVTSLTKPLSSFRLLGGAEVGAHEMGTINLLLVSAALLLLSLPFMFMVNSWDDAHGSARQKTAAAAEGGLGGSMWDAFAQVVRSPYLLGIAGFVFLLTWVTTPLYLQQSSFAKHFIASDDDRTRFFATIDFWVNTASLLSQFLLFGRLFKWLGTRVLLVALPVIMLAGYLVFAVQPAFAVVVWVYAIRRVVDYAITRPSRESLFTVVSRDEKYKAKSLIDTFIYRGGDATSGTVLTQITKALPISAVGWFGAAISLIWLVLAYGLGKAQERGKGEQAQSAAAPLAGASHG